MTQEKPLLKPLVVGFEFASDGFGFPVIRVPLASNEIFQCHTGDCVGFELDSSIVVGCSGGSGIVRRRNLGFLPLHKYQLGDNQSAVPLDHSTSSVYTWSPKVAGCYILVSTNNASEAMHVSLSGGGNSLRPKSGTPLSKSVSSRVSLRQRCILVHPEFFKSHGIERLAHCSSDLRMVSVIPRRLGPLDAWPEQLKAVLGNNELSTSLTSASDSSTGLSSTCNAVHLCPTSVQGSSDSCYSIKDHLHIDPCLLGGTLIEGKHANLSSLKSTLEACESAVGSKILFVSDLVLNHVSSDYDNFPLIKDALFTVEKYPQLQMALELERSIQDFASSNSHFLNISDEAQLESCMRELTAVLQNKHFDEYFRVESLEIDTSVNLLLLTLPSLIDLAWIHAVADLGSKRSGVSVCLLGGDSSKTDPAKAASPAFAGSVEYWDRVSLVKSEIQFRLASLWQSSWHNIVSSLRGQLHHERLVKKCKVGPLFVPYFSQVSKEEQNERFEGELSGACETRPLFGLNNGWIFGASSMFDLSVFDCSAIRNDTRSAADLDAIYKSSDLSCFQLPARNLVSRCALFMQYFRRSVVAWGDCVKIDLPISYDELQKDELQTDVKPSMDKGWPYEFLETYSQTLASVFDGIRVDNAHSTPIPFLAHIISLMRRTNPKLLVIAELFTSSADLELEYVLSCGIDSLVREGIRCTSDSDLERIVWDGIPYGLGQVKKSELACKVPVLVYDLTHDNEKISEILGEPAAYILPALLGFLPCATGSVLDCVCLKEKPQSVICPASDVGSYNANEMYGKSKIVTLKDFSYLHEPSVKSRFQLVGEFNQWGKDQCGRTVVLDSGDSHIDLSFLPDGSVVKFMQLTSSDSHSPASSRTTTDTIADPSLPGNVELEAWVCAPTLPKLYDPKVKSCNNLITFGSSSLVYLKRRIAELRTYLVDRSFINSGEAYLNSVSGGVHSLSLANSEGQSVQVIFRLSPDSSDGNSKSAPLQFVSEFQPESVLLAFDFSAGLTFYGQLDGLLRCEEETSRSAFRVQLLIDSRKPFFVAVQGQKRDSRNRFQSSVASLQAVLSEVGQLVLGLTNHATRLAVLQRVARILYTGEHEERVYFNNEPYVLPEYDSCRHLGHAPHFVGLFGYFLYGRECFEKEKDENLTSGSCMGFDLWENVRRGDWLVEWTLNRVKVIVLEILRLVQNEKPERANYLGKVSCQEKAVSLEKVFAQAIDEFVASFRNLPTAEKPRTLFEHVFTDLSGVFSNWIIVPVKGSSFLASLDPSASLCPVMSVLYLLRTLSSFFIVPNVPGLAAGFPHFQTGYMRVWGRDTFISLVGLVRGISVYDSDSSKSKISGGSMLLNTDTVLRLSMDSISAFASVVKFCTIPNLYGDPGRVDPRFNSRDSTWWFLRFVLEVDLLILKSQPRNSGWMGQMVIDLKYPEVALLRTDRIDLMPSRAVSPRGSGSKISLAELVLAVVEGHYNGISFREPNAGSALDEHMKDAGFNISVYTDHSTGLLFGGNEHNCGTWMDRMGSNGERNGVPATSRAGADVEINCLVLRVLDGLTNRRNSCREKPASASASGTRDVQSVPSWAFEWREKLKGSISLFFQDTGVGSMRFSGRDFVTREGAQSESHNSAGFQVRPNALLGLAVLGELPQNCLDSLHDRVDLKALLVKYFSELTPTVGIKTLSVLDKNYRPNYSLDWSPDPEVSCGFSYHNGPEWVWIYCQALRACIVSLKSSGQTELDSQRARLHSELSYILKSGLSRLSSHLTSSSTGSLPELTNSNGQFCPASCFSQAWSVGCMLELLSDLQEIQIELG